MRKSIVLIILIIYSTLGQQQKNTKGFIETNRVFLFDTINGNQASNNGFTYAFTFNRNFTNIPRVGLAIYTMDFQYSSVFSCQVTGDTTITAASLFITTENTGNSNQLYIMYIATDHDFLGVYMPGPLITYMLNQGTPNLVTQSFVFNFKEQISQSSQVSNIRVSVFLTGITSSSELVSNGYPTNHTYFFLNSKIVSSTNYQIDVSVNSQYGDITVKQVQYTIIYFDVTLMQNFRYLIDKGDVTLQNFGGTSDSSSKSITLTPLPNDSKFSNLMIFYGISGLQCRQGISIALSAFYQSYQNPSTGTTNVLLSMQTWKLTMMIEAEYNFIQYKSLNCDIPGSNCDGSCLTSTQPHYIVAGVCNFCQSSCLSCNVTNSNSKCDTCDQTRYLNNASGLCLCKSGFYDNTQTNVCNTCFPCLTCNLKGVCLSCDSSLNMVLNTILDSCECAPGYYSNFINSTNNTSNNRKPTTLNNTVPCLKCPQNCLYCLNSTFCLACNTITYLNQTGVCVSICSIDQKFDLSGKICGASSSSMFDQVGRLGYEWSYTSSQSQLAILLTFSQPDTLFYYYQNGGGYAMSNNNGNQGLSEAANFYYDDGANSAGYTGQSSGNGGGSAGASGFGGFSGAGSGESVGSMGSNPASIFNNPQLSNAGGNQNAASIGNLFQQGSIDYSALNGSYYGLGQQQFFKYLYQNYLISNDKSYSYYDSKGIPYGKYNLSTNPPIKNPSFTDALSKNIVFAINNEAIPFTMVPITKNQFKLTASVSKSYNGQSGSLIVKNPGLIRSGQTATQLTNVSKQIFIYNCAIPSYVSAAKNLEDSNSVIVNVLWGIGKYPLFIGFGWIFMPLMLVLQYIMSLNYIDITKPLNLQLFLASFSDFRNPSIFYNPVRNNIDTAVINQNQIYLNIQRYNRFDKGIDFMKNCFQFFFVPFLSAIFYGLVVGINKILNSYEKDIPFISTYFKPRFPLHIAAYTLIQALPVSFFFFAQLNDTRYNSANQNNSGYSIFNVAMSYLAFFLTCTIPIMVMTHMYFIYTTKENKVKSAKDFKALFKNLLQENPQNHQTACLNDPLWTGNQEQIVSYGFGLSIFGMALLFGFFISFFIDNYPWQLTGLIIITALILAFAASSDHFSTWPLKFFWVIFCALLLAFLFLLAGIGSNTSSVPCDQQNLGYLGIGFLYALILLAAIASIWILWFTVYQIYNNFFKSRRFIQNMNDKKQPIEDKPQRIKGFESNSKLKSTYLKNPIQSQIGSRSNIGSQIGSKVNIGYTQSKINNGSINIGYDKNRNNTYEKQPNTEDRMIIPEADGQEEDIISNNARQLLRFYQINTRTGNYVFVTDKTKKEYMFDQNIGKRLKEKQPIYIDINEAIIDRDDQYLGNYENLRPTNSNLSQKRGQQQPNQDLTVNQRQLIKNKSSSQQAPVVIRYTSSHEMDDAEIRKIVKRPEPIITNIYVINGVQYKKEGVDNNGLFIMRNLQTNQIRKVQGKNFMSKQQLQQFQEKASNQSLQKRLEQINQKEIQESQRRMFISPQIQKNKVAFQSKRKFRFNNQDYIDLGQQGNFFKVYNTSTNKQQKLTRDIYIDMIIKSFQNRVNINGIDYDYDSVGLNQSIHLKETFSRRPKIISQDQFKRLKQQNQQAFRLYVGQIPDMQKNIFVVNKTQVNKAQDQNNINNLLLIQSKAGRKEISIKDTYNISKNNDFSKKQFKEVQMVSYTTTKNNKEEFKQEIQVQEVDQGQGETIQDVLQKSPGPFQIFVVPSNKVDQVDGNDAYEKQDAVQKIILQGKNVMIYMQKAQRKHPGAIIFMVDLSNNEQYRLN